MLSLSPGIRIFVCTQPTDMRKQFNGLYAVVVHSPGGDVMTGDYFVFFNRLRHRCKILYWDRDGLVVWAKRLGRGRFQIPGPGDDASMVEIDGTTLAMILGGVDLQSVRRRTRYRASTPQAATADRIAVDGHTLGCLAATP